VFIDANPAMVKLFNAKDKETFLSTNILQFSPKRQPDGSSSLRKIIQVINIAFKQGTHSFEWLHTDKENHNFWCEIVLTKIHLDGSDLLHGVWRDISDRKELELQRVLDKGKIEHLNRTLEERVHTEVQKNREKDRQMLHQSRLAQMGEMISMIAHQWRQPLTSIAAASGVISLKAQLGKLDKETALEVSENIANYTQHLSATIDDFRDFFKQDKEKEATNYSYLVKNVLRIIETSLNSKNIEVIEELNCNDSFMTYSNELKQVLINLIKNAQDILVEKKVKSPYIKLKTYATQDSYILEISDNGGGIEASVMEKIFDPYFSTKLKKDGTGLGLYMSKTIVQEHCGGKLKCFNTQDGVCFRVEIPNA